MPISVASKKVLGISKYQIPQFSNQVFLHDVNLKKMKSISIHLDLFSMEGSKTVGIDIFLTFSTSALYRRSILHNCILIA